MGHDFSTNQGKLEPADVIEDFFRRNKGAPKIIYYCGHGYPDGAWAFHLYGKNVDRKITVSDMLEWHREYPGFLQVNIQACHSGYWCGQDKFMVHASTRHNENSCCDRGGSPVTKFLYRNMT